MRTGLRHVLGLGLAALIAGPHVLDAQTPPVPVEQGHGTTGPGKDDLTWKREIGLEMQRLKAIRDRCIQQAQEAEAGRNAAVRNSRIPEGAAFADAAREKVDCAQRAEQELAKLQGLLDTGRAGMARAGDKFQQDYVSGLRALLAGLQQVAKELQQPERINYEVFVAQVDGFHRQLVDFRNRYIRLLNDGDSQKFAATLFQASDALIASAGAWRREVEADRVVGRWTEPGDQRAAVARRERDAAAMERAMQWQTARQLIAEADSLAGGTR